MQTIARSLALALVAVAVAPSARAADQQRFETRMVGDRDTVTFDRTKAYVLVETPGAVAITLFKISTENERRRDFARRAEALAEAHDDWVEDHAQWQREMKRFVRGPNTPNPPVEPIEPTNANFAWSALEKSMMVTLGPLNRFSKGDGASLYLQEVPPGEYVYYGSIALGLGVCSCMGTVKFEAAPGKITSLRYDFAFMDPNGRLLETDRKPPQGVETDDAVVRLAMVLAEAAPHAADPRLPADMLTQAEFRAMPTLPNWYGTEINRLQPIPGVLAYDRDKVIDLKAAGAPTGAGAP